MKGLVMSEHVVEVSFEHGSYKAKVCIRCQCDAK